MEGIKTAIENRLILRLPEKEAEDARILRWLAVGGPISD